MSPKKQSPAKKPHAKKADAKELEARVAKLTDMAARAQAELQNAKIRMEKEAMEVRIFASSVFLAKLLPTIDNFRRAFHHLPDDLADHEWVKGVAAIEQDLMKLIEAEGLKKMEPLGQDVDPNKHEVLMEGEGKAGKIIEVFEDGYELHGKVLRVAKVKVGNGN